MGIANANQTICYFCMSLLLISNVKSSYSYRDNNDFVLFDMTGKPTLIKPDNNLFDLEAKDKDVYMFMIAPETGYLLAKKEGNHRVTESEAGDLYRFVEKDEKIEMGMETMDNPDSVSNALDFINSFGDNETTIYDFIQMTEFTHSDTNIMDVQNQFFSNKSYYDATNTAKYGDSSKIVSDDEDTLNSDPFDPENAGEAPLALVTMACNFYVKPLIYNALKGKEEFYEQSYKSVDDFNDLFVEDINLSDYSPNLDKASFMTAFNSAVVGQFDENLLVRSALSLNYQSLELPIAVGDGNTQAAENSRMKFTRNILFYNLFEVVADIIGDDNDNGEQEAANKNTLNFLRDSIYQISGYQVDGVNDDFNNLSELFSSKITAKKVEVMFWMIKFKDQIYNYIQYYLEQVAENSDFVNLFINNNALDYRKLEEVYKYFDATYYQKYKKFYLFVKNRRNLLLV